MSDMQQKDFVLSPNEFAFIQDTTKGVISVAVGPFKTSPSQSDALVVFNESTKRFEVTTPSNAIQTFITAPENWYVVLKNPVAGKNPHPKVGSSNVAPEDMLVGQKVNITGPVSFAAYPGQMARVIQGHRLRSNQYLLARVYNADVEHTDGGVAKGADGEDLEAAVSKPNDYVTGQLIVIKGTEVSFYIPPTGIEVLPIGGRGTSYIRDAVTLERLEYCILKDEDGNKRYMHGPDVIFPEPTEQFIENSDGGYKFKAIELSKISGIYIKVIADYSEDGKDYKVGDELFITGDNQMIYYPRPEHAIIDYGGRIMHYAIAIPAGEGRYVMNRLTGKISIVHGPAMFLPDPRTEVVVKRKLTRKECNMMYPGNTAVLKYNDHLSDNEMDRMEYATSKMGDMDELRASVVSKALSMDTFNRNTQFTPPRTLTLDTKFDGVVSVNVWTGYAVNVISKEGGRKVVCGPSTVLLEYDETLEVLQMSTGKPKTTDEIIETVYLRHENNKVSDIINVTTKDFVHAAVKVSYVVNFDLEEMDDWFSVENYVKFLCDRVRSMIKKEARSHNIEDFYQNYAQIITDTIFAGNERLYFPENGMSIDDADILAIEVDRDVAELIDSHQRAVIKKSLELTGTRQQIAVLTELAKLEQEKNTLAYQTESSRLKLEEEALRAKDELEQTKIKTEREQSIMRKQTQVDLQPLEDAVQSAQLERQKKKAQQEQDEENAAAAVEKARQDAYAATVQKIFESVSPDLIATMSARSNSEMLKAVTEAMSPYAIARGESVSETTNLLLRGTPLEKILDQAHLGINIANGSKDD